MATCDVCHNEYAKTFQLTAEGKTYTFDSFECAIYAVAPRCTRCECCIIGHGVEAGDAFYCCAHCAREDGHPQARDHV